MSTARSVLYKLRLFRCRDGIKRPGLCGKGNNSLVLYGVIDGGSWTRPCVIRFCEVRDHFDTRVHTELGACAALRHSLKTMHAPKDLSDRTPMDLHMDMMTVTPEAALDKLFAMPLAAHVYELDGIRMLVVVQELVGGADLDSVLTVDPGSSAAAVSVPLPDAIRAEFDCNDDAFVHLRIPPRVFAMENFASCNPSNHDNTARMVAGNLTVPALQQYLLTHLARFIFLLSAAFAYPDNKPDQDAVAACHFDNGYTTWLEVTAVDPGGLCACSSTRFQTTPGYTSPAICAAHAAGRPVYDWQSACACNLGCIMSAMVAPGFFTLSSKAAGKDAYNRQRPFLPSHFVPINVQGASDAEVNQIQDLLQKLLSNTCAGTDAATCAACPPHAHTTLRQVAEHPFLMAAPEDLWALVFLRKPMHLPPPLPPVLSLSAGILTPTMCTSTTVLCTPTMGGTMTTGATVASVPPLLSSSAAAAAGYKRSYSRAHPALSHLVMFGDDEDASTHASGTRAASRRARASLEPTVFHMTLRKRSRMMMA